MKKKKVRGRNRPIVVSHHAHQTVKKMAAERGTTMQAVADEAIEKATQQ